jgi:hypothetical protein
MKTRLIAAGVFLVAAGTPVAAHRLDEYLQATTISVEKDRVEAQIRLTPGVAVFPIVLVDIDTDADGVISETEQRAYAERVLRDLWFTVDGDRLRPKLVSAKFPAIQEMKEGLGEIQINFDVPLPPNGPIRRLIFENHHENRIAAYLVNCLVPRDPDIRIAAQNRNYQQSVYRLDYVQAGIRSGSPGFTWWSGGRGWLWTIALVLFARLAFLWRRQRA